MRKGGGDRDVGERVMRQDNGWWYVRILRRRLTPRGMFPEVQRVEDWWWVMDGDTWGEWRWNDAGGCGMGWTWEGANQVWICAKRTPNRGGGRWWWRVIYTPGCALACLRICEAWDCWEWAAGRTLPLH